jgi:hypothetical protein
MPFLIACCIFLVLMEMLGAAATKNLSQSPDFRSFYAAGYMLRTHPSQLYDLTQQKRTQDALVSPGTSLLPFYHPSYEALVYAPFSFLRYRAAYFAFIAFNVLLIIAAFFAARPAFSTPIPFLQPRPGLIFFFFVPVILTIMQGQDSILFLLLCCLTWRQLNAQKDMSAGCILALALFRFQLAIPIAILIAMRRGWSFTTGFLVASAAVITLCFGLVGRAGMSAWLHVLSASSLSRDQGTGTQHALGIHPLSMANLRGLLYACVTRYVSPNLAFWIVAATSAALFLWCLYFARRPRHEAAAFALAILCATLVSYHLNLHDVTLLLLPMILLAQHVRTSIALACYVIPAVVFLFANANWYFLIALPTLALLFYAAKSAGKSPSNADNFVYSRTKA